MPKLSFFSKALIFCPLLILNHLAEAENLPAVERPPTSIAKSYSEMSAPKKQPKYYSKKRQRQKDILSRKSWKPHFEDGNYLDVDNAIYLRTDLGLGLLYFSGISGNLQSNQYSGTFNSRINKNLSYNRSLLYEFIFGYRFHSHFKVAFGYLHQSNVTVQTKLIQIDHDELDRAQLVSNLSLNGLLAKFYLETPWPLYIKHTMTNFYLGLGVGAGWQSWTDVNYNTPALIGGSYESDIIPLKQRISPNPIYSADAGFKIQPAIINSLYSLQLGCKFNLWGSSKNIGALSNQGASKAALKKPFKIKNVYQWAPYLSFQWNFPIEPPLPKRYSHNISITGLATQFNVGLGLLYFKKVRGNLTTKPSTDGSNNQAVHSSRVSSDVGYNYTPLFEYLVQHRFNDYFQLALSYQNQSNISIQTKTVPSQTSNDFPGSNGRFSSYLSLNSLSAKFYFLVPIWNLDWLVRRPLKLLNFTPYFGFGTGPGWQTWYNNSVTQIGEQTTSRGFVYTGYTQPIKQKISTNMVLNLDWGFLLTHKNPSVYFSFVAGCKFNYWGQARNIGKLSQQGSYSLGLNDPIKIKKIHQWAPYLGVQWNFPTTPQKPQIKYLGEKSPNTWIPYFINLELFETKKALLTQFNVGYGTLYFSGVKGNLAPIPKFDPDYVRDVPIKGRLNYNKSPLFDYLLGYQWTPHIKFYLSWQHQANVTVQTQVLHTFNQSPVPEQNQREIYTADLVLDAITAKVYFELPWSTVFKNYVYTPYFAMGLGPSFQTWKRANANLLYTDSAGIFNTDSLTLRQKMDLSCAFLCDTGLRLQSAYPGSSFSALVGLKFNLWGQARSMGKLSQQYSPRYGLSGPISIKTIYQWAPYLGVQWSF
ncbi:MAG: hypothetical protein S4CHLAM7_01790 [Chlamydiae bacterium]|nr:hypothetical protein [Chlamydiota bacterium]